MLKSTLPNGEFVIVNEAAQVDHEMMISIPFCDLARIVLRQVRPQQVHL